MKTMKYIVALIALTMTMSSYSQMSEVPQVAFQSTSMMAGSGSTLPSAAVSGVTMADYGTSSNSNQSAIRRARPDSQDEPFQDPIGEGVLVLMLLAGGFALLQKRKAASVER